MMRWMNLRRFGNPCSKDNWTNYADWNYEKITLLKNIHNVTNSSFLRENRRGFWTLSKTREIFFLMKIIFDWQGTFGLFWDQSKIIWFWNIKRIHWMNHVRDGAIYEQFCTILAGHTWVLINTMRTNLLNWCNLVSISKNVVFYAFLMVRIY